MSNKKHDISQIKKYLQNELDTQAMHKLERNAQDDPFFAEAMEGFENAATDQQANYADMQKRLAERIEPAKERNIWLWRVLPLAACLLIALLIGYWYLVPKQPKQQLANVVELKPVVQKSDTIRPAEEVPSVPKKGFFAARRSELPSISSKKSVNQLPGVLDNDSYIQAPKVIYKTDTVEYKASDYKVRPNSTADALLKNMQGFEVDSSGNVTHQGQTITKARLNGKDYAGGNIQQAVKSLPADILEKIQVVDDYGDQAAKTGVKNGSPNKILNLTTADSAKNKMVAKNIAAPSAMQLSKVVVAKPQAMARVTSAANATPLVGQKAYDDYLTKNAVMPTGEIGTVEVGFTVADNGIPENVHIINSDSETLNNRALDLISKGSKWLKGNGKEVRIKIVFHK